MSDSAVPMTSGLLCLGISPCLGQGCTPWQALPGCLEPCRLANGFHCIPRLLRTLQTSSALLWLFFPDSLPHTYIVYFSYCHHYILCFFRAFFSSLATLALSVTVAAIQASPSKGQARHGVSSPCCLAGQSAQTLRSCCKAASQSTFSSCSRTCLATGGGSSVHGLFTVSLSPFHESAFRAVHVLHCCGYQ